MEIFDKLINVFGVISKHGDVSFLLYFFKQCLIENIQVKFQKRKTFGNFYF